MRRFTENNIMSSLLILIIISTNYFAQDGMFDSTFSADGIVITDFNNTDEKSYCLAIQNDDKLVVAGTSLSLGVNGNYDIAITRYNPDGSLDNSFDNDGIVITDLNGSHDFANSVAIQKDDKILVAGFSYNNSSHPKIVVARYNSDGSLDNTFDNDGIVTLNLIPFILVGNSIVIQNDDKILVGGTLRNGTGVSDIILIRLDSLGFLDNTFNNRGYVITDVLDGSDRGNALIVNNDNKIMVTGFLNSTIGLIQYNSNGTIDSSFNQNGISLVSSANWNEFYVGYGITMQVDGKILVVGEATNEFISSDSKILVVRFNKDGTLDNSFSENGITTIDINEFDRGTCIAVQSDNKIVVAGNAGNKFAILRLNPNGSLDNTFWGDGIKSLGFSEKDYGRSLAIQRDGKIVISGYSYNGKDWDFSTIRLNNPNYVTNIKNTHEMINEFALYPNYPNPFNPITKIVFSLSEGNNTIVSVYDILGNEIQVLVNKFVTAGIHELDFNAQNLSSGIYFYNIISGNYLATRKMMLIK